MIFKVYHHKTPTFGFGETPEFNESNFELIAEVECPAGEYGDVFRITNHIDEAWWKNPEVKSFKDRSRSTSVGDVIVSDDGIRRRCEMTGWSEF